MNRRKHAVFKRHFTMFRIYRLALKMLGDSGGAPVQFFVKKVAACGDEDGDTIGGERTIRSYLGTVMRALGRDHHVEYVQGMGYMVSCPYWQAMKAQHGSLWDPLEPERAERSHWLTREARGHVARAKASRETQGPPEGARKGGGQRGVSRRPKRGGGPLQKPAPQTPIRSNDRVDRIYKRPGGRPSGRQPAPVAMRKLGRRVIEVHPPPHCPRLHRPDELAYAAAVRLLCRGYWQHDVGRTVNRALRITDTAAADGLPVSSGKYFWGVLEDLVAGLKRPGRWRIDAERERFWGEQLGLAEQLAREGAEMGEPAFGVNPRIRERLAAIAARKTAATKVADPAVKTP